MQVSFVVLITLRIQMLHQERLRPTTSLPMAEAGLATASHYLVPLISNVRPYFG